MPIKWGVVYRSNTRENRYVGGAIGNPLGASAVVDDIDERSAARRRGSGRTHTRVPRSHLHSYLTAAGAVVVVVVVSAAAAEVLVVVGGCGRVPGRRRGKKKRRHAPRAEHSTAAADRLIGIGVCVRERVIGGHPPPIAASIGYGGCGRNIVVLLYAADNRSIAAGGVRAMQGRAARARAPTLLYCIFVYSGAGGG